jgi:hypothetical protein
VVQAYESQRKRAKQNQALGRENKENTSIKKRDAYEFW